MNIYANTLEKYPLKNSNERGMASLIVSPWKKDVAIRSIDHRISFSQGCLGVQILVVINDMIYREAYNDVCREGLYSKDLCNGALTP